MSETGDRGFVGTRITGAIQSVLRSIPRVGARELSEAGRQALTGGAWSAVGYGATQVLRLASTLILARHMLSPDAFGLVGLVNVLLTGLTMLSDLGVGINVVQHSRGEDRAFVDTAFSIQAVRGVALWGVGAILSVPFANFYQEPRLVALVMVAGLSVAIRGFSSASVWTLTRTVRLEKLTLLTVLSEGVGLCASVGCAILDPSAWALVWGTLAAALVYTVGSHFLDDSRTRFVIDRAAAQSILRFGGWMFISTATFFAGSHAERLVLGKCISPADLGCYSVALMIATAPSRGVGQVIEQVFFPMIARARRGSEANAARQFQRVKWMSLGCAGCVAGMFILLGPLMVHTLLPPKYAQTGWMLQLLGVRAGLEVFYSSTTSMLFACGISKYAAIGNIARVGVLIPGLWLALGHGSLAAAVWVVVVSPLAAYWCIVAGLSRALAGTLRVELMTLALLVLTCAAAAWLKGSLT